MEVLGKKVLEGFSVSPVYLPDLIHAHIFFLKYAAVRSKASCSLYLGEKPNSSAALWALKVYEVQV